MSLPSNWKHLDKTWIIFTIYWVETHPSFHQNFLLITFLVKYNLPKQQDHKRESSYNSIFFLTTFLNSRATRKQPYK